MSLKLKNKIVSRWLLIIFSTILFLSAFSVVGLADSNVKISVVQNGQTLSEKSYTADELLAFGSSQAVYSSFDSSDTPELTSAKGVTIANLLSGLGIQQSDLNSIHFYSSDGWDKTYSKKFLLDTSRNYYGGLASAQTTAEDGSVSYDTSLMNPTSVASMLAVQTYTERNGTAENYGSLSSADGVRICYGQQSYDEKVSPGFGKHINRLEITINEGASYAGGGSQEPGGDNPNDNNNNDDDGNKKPNYNGSVADSLTVTVGYYGQEFVEKKVFSASEMAAMANYKQVYTYIDSMPAVCVSSAYGVKVTDLLEAAGIDVNSVEKITFRCMDGYGGEMGKTLTKSKLLDTNRYYFPNLATHWDFDTASVTAGATAGAIKVEPMVAVKENWKRVTKKTDPSKVVDFSNCTENYRYRILTGQSYNELNKATANEAASWIFKLEVQLGGTGQGTSTGIDNSAKVGSLLTTDYGKGKLVQLTEEQTASVENSVAMQQQDGAGVQKWRVYEMDDDAMAMDNIVLDNPWTPYIVALLVLCFLAGGFIEYVSFRKQIGKGLIK